LFETYVSDKEVKETVLLQNPCPGNLHPVRKMDDFLDDLMKDKKKADLESILERVQKKNLETMGPMARLWVAFDQATNLTGLPLTKECLNY